MDPRTLLGATLVALPVSFNVLFIALGRTFSYPDILRRDTREILERFRAGGSRLLVTWWLFMLTALALVVVAPLLAVELAAAGPWIAGLSMVLGVLAGLVQALGLARWPFLVPLLARRHAEASSDAERASVAILFEATHRYLGVAVGEHLGYLLTGTWTVVVGLGLIAAPGSNDLIGAAGVVVGAALSVGSLEFVGRAGDHGWPFAERLVPIAYLTWSVWLIAVGVGVLADLR